MSWRVFLWCQCLPCMYLCPIRLRLCYGVLSKGSIIQTANRWRRRIRGGLEGVHYDGRLTAPFSENWLAIRTHYQSDLLKDGNDHHKFSHFSVSKSFPRIHPLAINHSHNRNFVGLPIALLIVGINDAFELVMEFSSVVYRLPTMTRSESSDSKCWRRKISEPYNTHWANKKPIELQHYPWFLEHERTFEFSSTILS